MSYFIAGCCCKCDVLCYEVRARYEDHERNPGEPKRLGKPLAGATNITFMLYGGSLAKLLMCESCAKELSPADYAELWRKSLRSYARELSGNEGTEKWYRSMFAEGLLCEVGRVTIKESA